MTKRRRLIVTVPEETWLGGLGPGEHGQLVVESVEDIPEPNRVQEFRVRVETKPSDVLVTADRISRLLSASMSWPSIYEITEVESP